MPKAISERRSASGREVHLGGPRGVVGRVRRVSPRGRAVRGGRWEVGREEFGPRKEGEGRGGGGVIVGMIAVFQGWMG